VSWITTKVTIQGQQTTTVQNPNAATLWPNSILASRIYTCNRKKTHACVTTIASVLKQKSQIFLIPSVHRPMARASTPTTPAILATTAPVGAGAPPAVDELDAPVAEEDSAWSRALAEDLADPTAAVRDEATDDSGRLLVAPPALLM
jgi:hypothetical protein